MDMTFFGTGIPPSIFLYGIHYRPLAEGLRPDKEAQGGAGPCDQLHHQPPRQCLWHPVSRAGEQAG